MNTQGKVWGITGCLIRRDNFEVHRIEAQQGGYCSKHKHAHKYNMFYVEEGALEILIWNGKHADRTVLHAGQYATVPPTVYHRFRALESTLAFEIYWVALEGEDIERDDAGGME